MPTCPQCLAELPPDAPAGLCPNCLLHQALNPNTLLSDPDPKSKITGEENQKWTPPSPADLAFFFPELDILSLLGRGGMGAVYKARQKSLDRIVALKILPPRLALDTSFAQRFTSEAHALARLNHPNIVTIYDFGIRESPSASPQGSAGAPGEEPGTPSSSPSTPLYFFLMEFIDGPSLRQLPTPLDPDHALAIVPQICDALQYAHDRGIVHRDIKPENILLTQSATIKIADFGLAKLITPTPPSPLPPPEISNPEISNPEIPTSEISNLKSEIPPSPSAAPNSAVAGTPAYMAPEQSTSPTTVDHRADIYALGVVFYQLLTGQLPPPPPNPLTPPSAKIHLDIRLDQIVLRALQHSPDLRYNNATELKTEIQTYLASPTPASESSSPPQPSPPLPRGGRNVPSPAPNAFPSPNTARAQQDLYIPSLGLRVITGLNLLILGIPTIGMIVSLIFVPPGGISNLKGVDVLLILSFGFLLNFFIFSAASSMARLKNYSRAVIACILTLFALPAAPLGLIFAIWAFIVLNRPDIRLAFDKPEPPPPSRDPATARKLLFPPSLALRIFALINIGLLILPFFVSSPAPIPVWTYVAPSLILLPLYSYIYIAMSSMARLRHIKNAMIAAFITLFFFGLKLLSQIAAITLTGLNPNSPVLAGTSLFSLLLAIIFLPFAIRTIYLLSRPDIKAAFITAPPPPPTGPATPRTLVSTLISNNLLFALLLFFALYLIPHFFAEFQSSHLPLPKLTEAIFGIAREFQHLSLFLIPSYLLFHTTITLLLYCLTSRPFLRAWSLLSVISVAVLLALAVLGLALPLIAPAPRPIKTSPAPPSPIRIKIPPRPEIPSPRSTPKVELIPTTHPPSTTP